MGLKTTFHLKNKKSTKSLKNQDIELPVGVTFKGQEKKHKFLPKFFSSIFKSKYTEIIKATKSNKKNNIKTFDNEESLHYDTISDSEKTIFQNDFTYINKAPFADIHSIESETTIHTLCEDYSKNPLQSFLSRKVIDLKGRNSDTLPVLNDDLAEMIRCRLPKLLQEATTWNLLYSLDQHGATLKTLYEKIQDQGPCVMIIKNSEDEIFGAFVSEPFDPMNKGFFGTPECFLWKADKYQFKKFSATHLNQYFMVAENNFLAMGGGNGNFGFYIDEDIQYGYSSVCDTFKNEVLTKEDEFECYGCEIWGFEF